MVNKITQQNFSPAPFSGSRFNLHVHPQDGADQLVVFIHGLGGRGYRTWNGFPRLLFEDNDTVRDVGVYDYKSGLRRLALTAPSLDFCINQLTQSLREVEGDYSSIFLVGHSLGGVLSEAAAKRYLESKLLAAPDLLPLAGLILMAAPRAGSRWAIPALSGILKEFAILRLLSKPNEEIDRFFSSRVESMTTAAIEPRIYLLPRYACIAGGDRFVNQFSATFGITELQRAYYSGSHSSIVKPDKSDDEQVAWVKRVIGDILDVRQQWRREQNHKSATPDPVVAAPLPFVVTEFRGSTAGATWEAIYHEARHTAATADLAVHDYRQVERVSTDLLITAAAAHDVLDNGTTEKKKVMTAYRDRRADDRLTLGISAIGRECDRAETAINTWLGPEPVLPHVYVEGVENEDKLRDSFLQWMHLVIARNTQALERQAASAQHMANYQKPHSADEQGKVGETQQ